MNKELAMLRAYPQNEIIDMLMDESKKFIEKEVEQKRRMLAIKALIQNDDSIADDAQKINMENVLQKLRTIFKQTHKSSATYFLYKMRDAIKNGKTEKFNPETIISTGEPKNQLDIADAKAIQKEVFKSLPTDHIYISTREANQLKELWETQKNIKAANIPSDIFFSNEIAIRDMIITITDDNRFKIGKFKTTRNIRIDIFENPMINPNNPDEPFVVGTLSIEVIIEPALKNNSFPKFTIPLLIQQGFNGIGMADIYATNQKDQVISLFKNEIDNIYNSADIIWADIENYLKIWYGIQLALLHPIIKDVFKRPSTEKIAHEEPKKGGKTRTVYTYIKKHVIQPHEFDPPKPSDNTDEKTSQTWSTLLWHVTGHWRYYRNGKKTFIKPYWKGPLREIKNTTPRNRNIIIPNTI